MEQAARSAGIHVTVDTCGYCGADRFDEIIKLTDLFLFDCKHMDPEQHMKLTGQDNALILRNLKAALSSTTEVRVRVPLIPNMNDSDENFADLSSLLKEFKRDEIDIMPCHAFGRNKYDALSKAYPAVLQYTTEQLMVVMKRISRHGLNPVLV